MMNPGYLQLEPRAQLKLRPYSRITGFQPVPRIESWKLSLLWPSPFSHDFSRTIPAAEYASGVQE
ncbi:hypothetical protein J3R74_002295 [Puniceicoccus vermicola]